MLVIAFGLLAAPARGATVDASGGTLRYVAGAGEANAVTITPGAGIVTVDEASPTTLLGVGSGCSSAGPGRATCSTTGLAQLSIDLGDGNDTLTSTSTLPASVADGPGNDVVALGAGNDTLIGAPGDDRLDAGAGNDTFTDAGGAGADVLIGGAGTDTADYSPRGAAVTV